MTTNKNLSEFEKSRIDLRKMYKLREFTTPIHSVPLGTKSRSMRRIKRILLRLAPRDVVSVYSHTLPLGTAPD